MAAAVLLSGPALWTWPAVSPPLSAWVAAGLLAVVCTLLLSLNVARIVGP